MADDTTATLDSEELLHLALRATQNNQTENAIELLKKALKASPNDGKVYYLLGALHAEIGMYERAIQEMSKAVELEPEMPTAHFQLGLLYITSGRVADAEQAWRALDALDQENPLYLFKRGMLHLANDDFQACIDDLTAGVERNSVNDSLNNDMRKIITAAETAIADSRIDDPQQPASNENTDTAKTKGGKNVLLSAYQRNDEE